MDIKRSFHKNNKMGNIYKINKEEHFTPICMHSMIVNMLQYEDKQLKSNIPKY